MTAAPKLFGTDGIRGSVGQPPLDEATVRRLGLALAMELRQRSPAGGAVRCIVGGDTRDSTPLLASWLGAGLDAGDAGIVWLGTVPTPAVAYLTREKGVAGGVAVSASHNPYPDNGIKLFDADGRKWAPTAEAALEQRLAVLETPSAEPPMPPVDGAAIERYLGGLRSSLAGEAPLAGLCIALDAAHGAAAPFAESLFVELGARVVALGHRPDGRNINLERGSTHPEALAERVREQRCDLGFAFDGDADRAIVVDESGAVRDGDAILYLWARELHRRGALPGDRIVATSMSNLGLERALADVGIGVERCDVGDRAVVATMRREGLVLGGEQSGHVVHLGLSTTGDGLLTALQIAALCAADARPLSKMLAGFSRFPQLIHNVRVEQKPDLDSLPRIAAARRRVEATLGDEGRLVLRYSGTEPLARIMIEGREEERIRALAGDLAEALAAELG